MPGTWMVFQNVRATSSLAVSPRFF
jgi:hypothetical protein